MACCYIAASMIAFIINTCEVLDVDIKLQYNESLDPSKTEIEGNDGQRPAGTEPLGPTVLSLGGMTCAACTGNVERALISLEGVERVAVSLPFQEARVIHDPSVSKAAMVSAVEDAGYDVDLGQRAPQQRIETLQHNKELRVLSQAFAGSSQLSTLLFALGTGADVLGWGGFLERILTPLGRQAMLLCLTLGLSFHHGLFIHQSTLSQAKQLSINMNTLITLSTTVGILLSIFNIAVQGPAQAYTYFQTVSGLILIVTAGRYLDLLSRRQATSTFVGLYALLQETASVKIIGHKVGSSPRV